MDLTRVADDEFEAEAARRKKAKDDYYQQLMHERYEQRIAQRLEALKKALKPYGIPEDQMEDVYADCVNVWYDWDS